MLAGIRGVGAIELICLVNDEDTSFCLSEKGPDDNLLIAVAVPKEIRPVADNHVAFGEHTCFVEQ